jgi:hypothetical protein
MNVDSSIEIRRRTCWALNGPWGFGGLVGWWVGGLVGLSLVYEYLLNASLPVPAEIEFPLTR